MALPHAVLCLCFALSSQVILASSAASPLQLDIGDDGKQLKLRLHRLEIGQVCELWCYEGGPFRYGKATKRDDGSVVFVHTAGRMTATTVFTPTGQDRVFMDIVVEGPVEELKRVSLMGPCMQFWHSEAFRRQDTLVEFAARCFLYTIRGPVGMMDTARGQMKGYKSDAPENNPPWTQWYVPFGRAHPGDIWAFGASGDRPIHDLVGVASRDRKWLAAIGCRHTTTLGQGWHDCIHHVPDIQKYWDAGGSRIVHRSVLYVMPNDKGRLLESFRRDFPEATETDQIQVSAGEGGTLRVRPRLPGARPLTLSIDIDGSSGRQARGRDVNWKAAPWGGFVRDGRKWRMWAYPNGGSLELWASLGVEETRTTVDTELDGKDWTAERSPSGVPVLVRRASSDGAVAVLMWERSELGWPAKGILMPGASTATEVSVRGRLSLHKGSIDTVRARWTEADEDWKRSVPFRMPFDHH